MTALAIASSATVAGRPHVPSSCVVQLSSEACGALPNACAAPRSLSKSVGARCAARRLLVAAPPCPSNTAASLYVRMVHATGVIASLRTTRCQGWGWYCWCTARDPPSVEGALQLGVGRGVQKKQRTSGRRPRAAHVPHSGCGVETAAGGNRRSVSSRKIIYSSKIRVASLIDGWWRAILLPHTMELGSLQ